MSPMMIDLPEELYLKRKATVQRATKERKVGFYHSAESWTSDQLAEFGSKPNNELKELHVNPFTLPRFLEELTPKYYRKIKLDPSWNCNLRCSYCQIDFKSTPKEERAIDLRSFEALTSKIIGAHRLNIGDGSEPLTYPKLPELVEMIGDKLDIAAIFSIQTNGLSLQKLESGFIGKSKVNLLSVSIDTLDTETHKFQRDGSKVGHVFRHMGRLKDAKPDLHLRLVSVVTSKTIGDVASLIDFAKSFGIDIFTLRQVAIPPRKENFEVQGKVYPVSSLGISLDQFLDLENMLLDRFGNSVELEFADYVNQCSYCQNKQRNGWVVPVYSVKSQDVAMNEFKR